MVTQPPERVVDATRPLQFVEHIVEHRMEPAGLNRVKLRADLTVVPGIFWSSRTTISQFERPRSFAKWRWCFQKGRTLHEENRKTRRARNPPFPYCVLAPVRCSGSDRQQRRNEANRRSRVSTALMESEIAPSRQAWNADQGGIFPTVADQTQPDPQGGTAL